MLGTKVSAGGRLALRAAGSRTLVWTSLQPRDRLVAFQVDALSSRQGFSNVRNYWWSKPPPSQPTSEAKSGTSSVTPDEMPVSAESLSDQIVQTEAITPTSTPAPEPISAVTLPVELSSTASDVATNIVAPLQYGDFAALGLASWWPSGIISWSFELLQVSTGMPWFYTIVLGSLFWRAALIPSALTSMRNAARLRPYSEQIKALDDKAQGVKDRAAQMEIMLKKQQLIQKAGVSLQSMFLPPVIQMVGNFGLFFAIKNMMQLPVVQLTQSGVWFLPDLTLTGDYIMPTLVILGMNLQFSIMKKELDPSKPVMAHVMNVMRVASIATLPMMSWMPSGLWLSMLTGMALTLTQSSLLRIPRIRQMVGIPPAPPMPPVTMRDTGKMILEWYGRVKGEAVANHAMANQRKPNWTTLPKASRRAR